MVSNLLADTYETCFDTSRPQERPQRIAGGFDREGTAPFDVRVLRRIGNTVRARLQQIDERAVQLRADTERAMGDYLKHHSTEGDTVMASVEDYPYFLDELKNLNMLVTRAATDEEYANSVEKLYMSFQQLNRAFNTDEENVREQLDRINGMLKGQQFGPRGGRLSLHVDFHPIDRQFKSSLGRIMSKLDDWTRNARSNPMETRKAFAGCETFIGRLQAELGQIRDTNGIKEYGARNLDPRVRSSFYAIVHHNDLPDERISSTGGKSGGALQELTSFVYGAALIYLLGYVQGKDVAQLADPMLTPKSMPSPVAYKGTIGKRADEFDPGEVPAMAMLEYYLAEPDAERIFATQALAMSYALNPRNKSVEPHAVDVLHRIEALHGENESAFMICSSWNPLNCTRLKFQSGLCIGEDMRTTEPHVGMVFSDIQRDAAKAKSDDYNPLNVLDENEAEAFKTQWAAFWHFANVMQFSEYFHAIGDAALSDTSMYEPLRNGLRNIPDVQEGNDSAWNDVLADSDLRVLRG